MHKKFTSFFERSSKRRGFGHPKEEEQPNSCPRCDGPVFGISDVPVTVRDLTGGGRGALMLYKKMIIALLDKGQLAGIS